MRTRRNILLTPGAMALGALPFTLQAQQTWPSRAISLIAPYPAGGGVDTVARFIAERLATRLGQAIVVDNKPGAGGTIGATALSRATPDGYTLMLGSIVDYAIAPHAHKNLAFDMAKDMVPIADVGYGTVVLVVNPELPARNVKELIALAKSKPGALSYASSGIGGLQHLNAEMFKQMAGIDLVHVPYRGTAQLLPDLLTGVVPMAIDSLPAHLPHIRSGKLRALAVASSARSTTLPDVPTMSEAGVAGYESATNYTLFAPARTPPEVLAVLNREINAVLKREDVLERFGALGIVVTGGTTEQATAKVTVEMGKWANVIRKGNLQLN